MRGPFRKILRREGAEPSALANFCRAVIQAVTLFGAETWVLLAPMVQRLEGVYMDFLLQVTKFKAKILRGGYWK